ncbi:hypothetical protein FOL47_001698 [Perkinsus chesapeaki]|uniref:Uncharacterized protein n=1 Tax=Perkinsus chesapeaki TaxID=330153 RepID=A0A7J6MHQ6_PERCH|nr:hypothetical protein FOL47_001698 [Perkinsus chesapeaki]
MLPQLIQVMPLLQGNIEQQQETAFALANHFKVHKNVAKHESIKPFVYRTMTSLFTLPEAASAIGMHLMRIIPDNYIDKLLNKLQEESGTMEASYLQLLEDYTKEYPARVASMHLDRVQSLITEEESDHNRATGIRLIHILCKEECMDVLKSWQIFKRKQKYLFDRQKSGEETNREVLLLAADVEPGMSGVEYIWSNVSPCSGHLLFNPQAWIALATVLRRRGKALLDDALNCHGGIIADLTPMRITELANAQLDSESTSEESLRAMSACLAALADIDITNIGRSAYIASNVANQTTSKEISPMGRRLNGYLKSVLRRSPLAQLALTKGAGRATLPVLKRLLKTVRVPSGIFGGPYMVATSWKKFINRLLKSGEAKPNEVYDTLMEGIDTTPGNAVLGLSALGRCRPLQFSMNAKDAIEKVLNSEVDIGGQAGVRSLAVIAMALLLKSMPYTQALAVAEVLFAPATEVSSSSTLLGPILWMLPYWTLIDHTQIERVVDRLILGCRTPSTALPSGYGLTLLVTLHWDDPEVLHFIRDKLTESTPVPPHADDVCARVLVCGDVVGGGDSQAFSGELGAIGAGLAGVDLENSASVEPQLRVLYLGSLYGCPGTLPIIPMDKLHAPRNCDNPLTIVDKLEKYDDECTVGVAVQLMHTAESITWASANRKRREINNLSYIKQGTALQLVMEACSEASETSPRHEMGLLAVSQLSEALPRKAMRIILDSARSLSSDSELKIRILSYCGEVGLSDLFTLYERASSLPKESVENLLCSISLLPQNVFDFEGPLIAALVAVAKGALNSVDTSRMFVTDLNAAFRKWKDSPDDDGASLCREIVESLIDKVPQLFAQPHLWRICQAILEDNIDEISLVRIGKLNPLLVARIRKFQAKVRQEILQDTILNKERFRPEQLLKVADDFVQSSNNIDESRRTILGLAERFRSKDDDLVARDICRDLASAISIAIAGRGEMRLAATSFDVTERIDDILPVELANNWRPPCFGVMKDIQRSIDYVGKCLTCGYVFNDTDDPNVYKLVQNMFANCSVS